jgi:hypothetical protein
MDQRLLDVPFSAPFCRLMLSEALGWLDLQEVWPEVGKSLAELADAHARYVAVQADGKLVWFLYFTTFSFSLFFSFHAYT